MIPEAKGVDWVSVGVSIGVDVLMVGHNIVNGLCMLVSASSTVVTDGLHHSAI
jgi:hypothetical protein